MERNSTDRRKIGLKIDDELALGEQQEAYATGGVGSLSKETVPWNFSTARSTGYWELDATAIQRLINIDRYLKHF